jgi:hypothetical protein
MPPAILAALITAIVPVLVQEAEKLFGSDNGDKKRQWVVDAVHSLLTLIEKKVPSWAGMLLEGTEPLIDEAIDFSLSKLGVN